MNRVLLNLSMSPWLGCKLRNRLLRAIGVPMLPDTKISRGTRLGGTRIEFHRGFGANEECWFDDEISFGRNVRVGPRVMILTKGHPIGGPDQRRGWRDVTRPVVIGDGVWLQAGCVIKPGVHIADGCIIGIGAVVIADTIPDGVYAGNPAVRIGSIDGYGIILRAEL